MARLRVPLSRAFVAELARRLQGHGYTPDESRIETFATEQESWLPPDNLQPAGWRSQTDTAAGCLSATVNIDRFRWLTSVVASLITGN
ncbi:hypothetical protein [Citrobacter sp. S-77]|uniref:hypothetical protein n=1 Tax=Citrobacter sp. S-77 TaxID=1080067 RepID=UPI0005EE2A8C|nr:hypothetical protein [Citrobacter sp. S-77]